VPSFAGSGDSLNNFAVVFATDEKNPSPSSLLLL